MAYGMLMIWDISASLVRLAGAAMRAVNELSFLRFGKIATIYNVLAALFSSPYLSTPNTSSSSVEGTWMPAICY